MKLSLLILLTALCVAGIEQAPDEAKPKGHWADVGTVVTIFGNVDREGCYTIAVDRPITLYQIVTSAGIHPGNGVNVVLQRPSAQGAKCIRLASERLKDEGDIPIQANDVIQVTGKRAAATQNADQ